MCIRGVKTTPIGTGIVLSISLCNHECITKVLEKKRKGEGSEVCKVSEMSERSERSEESECSEARKLCVIYGEEEYQY